MRQATFVDSHGKEHDAGVGADKMARHGLGFLCPVQTPRGRGVVVGLVDDMIYIRHESSAGGDKPVAAYAVAKLGHDVTPLASVPAPSVTASTAAASPTMSKKTRASAAAPCAAEQRHRLKRIVVCGQALRVVMQDKRGPCPVFALANVLALQGKITLGFDDDDSFITSRELRATIANYLWSTPPLPSFAQDGQRDTPRGEAAEKDAHCSRNAEAVHTDVAEEQRSARATSNAKGAVQSPDNARRELYSARSGSDGGSCNEDNKEPGAAVTASGPTLRDVVHDIVLLEKARAELIGDNASDNLAERTLARLYDGMDVDPIFTDPEAFVADRWTPLFALGGVRLLHGWVIEPGGSFAALRRLSFNELAMAVASSPLAPPQRGPTAEDETAPSDFALTGDEAADGGSTRRTAVESAKTEGRSVRGEQLGARHELAKLFYDSTYASQMTSYGLRQLHGVLAEGEFAVLFWRNHFFTLTKLKRRLLLLCSNESFADKPSFVFSVLRDASAEDGFTDGDGVEVDAVLSFVQAMTGNQFSEEQVHAAYASLVERKARELPAAAGPVAVQPEEVLEYLRATPAKATQNHSAGGTATSPATTRSNKSEAANALESKDATGTPLLLMDAPGQSEAAHIMELVHKFVEAFPGLTEPSARDYLTRHHNDLAAAADAYCLEHLS